MVELSEVLGFAHKPTLSLQTDSGTITLKVQRVQLWVLA